MHTTNCIHVLQAKRLTVLADDDDGDSDVVICVSGSSLCTLPYPSLNPQTMQCIDFYLYTIKWMCVWASEQTKWTEKKKQTWKNEKYDEKHMKYKVR